MPIGYKRKAVFSSYFGLCMKSNTRQIPNKLQHNLYKLLRADTIYVTRSMARRDATQPLWRHFRICRRSVTTVICTAWPRTEIDSVLFKQTLTSGTGTTGVSHDVNRCRIWDNDPPGTTDPVGNGTGEVMVDFGRVKLDVKCGVLKRIKRTPYVRLNRINKLCGPNARVTR